MHAYIINMDSAPDRWSFVESHYRKTQIPFTRVSGVVGKDVQLPIPEYNESKYIACHGQRTNFGALGCYMSHLKCLRLFLDSNQKHAVIAEDDSLPDPKVASIIESAMRYEACWDILRICGFHDPHPVPFAKLIDNYELAICFTRLCGTGAYLVSRHAAEVLLQKLVPMFLPIDHALDREWAYGLRAATVIPLPISQQEHSFATQIPTHHKFKLHWSRRYWTVFPFRCRNELQRIISRRRQLQSARRIANAIDAQADAQRMRIAA